jgi:hypothetical protein
MFFVVIFMKLIETKSVNCCGEKSFPDLAKAIAALFYQLATDPMCLLCVSIFIVITPLQHRAFAQIQTLLPYRGKL